MATVLRFLTLGFVLLVAVAPTARAAKLYSPRYLSREIAGPILQARGKTETSATDKEYSVEERRTLREHFAKAIRAFDNEHLPERQSLSLARYLRDNGYQDYPHIQDGYFLLAQLSKANRARVEEELSRRSQEFPGHQEVREFLSSLHLVFVHRGSTNDLEERSGMPNLSARSLKSLGFTGGKWTKPFNVEVIKSDDNVFFSSWWRLDPTREARKKDPYGDWSFFPKYDYARERGWISQYQMSPPQLLESVMARAPQDAALFMAEFRKHPEHDWISFSSENPEMAKLLRRHLHRVQFTVEDWKALFPRVVLATLSSMYQDAPSTIQPLLEAIRSGGGRHNPDNPIEADFREVELDKIVEGNMQRYFPDFTSRPEFKIPVAVPSNQGADLEMSAP